MLCEQRCSRVSCGRATCCRVRDAAIGTRALHAFQEPHCVRRILFVGLHDSGRADGHGVTIGLPARVAPALGACCSFVAGWWCCKCQSIESVTIPKFTRLPRIDIALQPQVEYMNKCFHGDGRKFTPFSLADLEKQDV